MPQDPGQHPKAPVRQMGPWEAEANALFDNLRTLGYTVVDAAEPPLDAPLQATFHHRRDQRQI